MSAVALHIRPAFAVVKRDFLVAWSYRIRFITGLIGSIAPLIVFYYVSRLVQVDAFSPGEYFAFVTVGILIHEILTATLNIPHMMLRQELVAGTFERMLLAPGGTITSIVALMVYPALYSLVTVTALVGAASILFGLDIEWSTVPLALPLALLSLLAFAPFGMLLLAAVVVGKKAPPGTTYLLMGMTLIAGLYFPVTLLPDWIQWASEVQPFTPAVELLRWALAGQALIDPAWLSVTKLVAFATVAMPVSLAAMSAALRLSRRRGTILEY
ncbi:MAG: ABC transporter permease [Gemmatimonadota bacterium]